MSESQPLTASSGHQALKSLHGGQGQDWANWLRQAHGPQPPGRPPPGPSRTEATWTALVHLACREGFAVEHGNCAGADGFATWRDHRIRIRPGTPPEQAVTALAHQIGHILLHAPIARLDRSGTVPCQGIRKVEADSVALIVATRLGISASAITFPHVSSWAGTDPRARPGATIQSVSDRVLTAAARITAHLDAELASRKPPTGPRREASAADTQPLWIPEASRHDLISIHQTAARFFRDQLPASWVPGYLTGRGFDPAVQHRWQAGYAPPAWDGLTGHLRAAGYPDSLIETAGLARRSRRGFLIDTFRDRAMLPIRSVQGTVIAFIGRAPDEAGPGVPKYLNSRRTTLYDKSTVLYGLWEARSALASGARPVIVEGPLDAIAVTTACPGRYAGLSPCGTALTTRQAKAIDHTAALRTAGILIAFDADQAGQRATISAHHLLAPLTSNTTAARFPAGKDPAQILHDDGATALAALLDGSTPLADLVIDAEVTRWEPWLGYADGKISALHATAPLIAALPPANIARQVARLASRLSLDHPTVTEAVTEAVTDIFTSPVRHEQHRTTTGRPGLLR
jgi:DNA primase